MSGPNRTLRHLTLIFGAACLGMAAGVTVMRAEKLSDLESGALQELNQARQQAGAGSLVAEWRLSTAARWQAGHMARTGEIGHERTQGSGFFDVLKTPEGRRTAALYFDGGTEALARSASLLPRKSISTLLDAPYHRIALLEPAAQEVGVGVTPHAVSTIDVLDAGFEFGNFREPAPQSVIVWPTPGALNVPAAFIPETETPNPAPWAKAVGYIVTVQVGEGYRLRPDVFSMTVSDTGEAVPGKVLSGASDKHMPAPAAAFVPQQPLAWDTEYKVTFQGTATFGSVKKSWTFRTEKAPEYSLEVIAVDAARASLNFAFTSPVQPAHICIATSTGVKYSFARVGAEKANVRVSDCGKDTCAVQVYLSKTPDCTTKEVRVGALFGGKEPRTNPELTGHSD